ncbi:MAG: hypothetical protein M1819_006222 [Sarea resinae]|nr:MAG: hypothetical protein M1819_006222 [Sarea resinae]
MSFGSQGSHGSRETPRLVLPNEYCVPQQGFGNQPSVLGNLGIGNGPRFRSHFGRYKYQRDQAGAMHDEAQMGLDYTVIEVNMLQHRLDEAEEVLKYNEHALHIKDQELEWKEVELEDANALATQKSRELQMLKEAYKELETVKGSAKELEDVRNALKEKEKALKEKETDLEKARRTIKVQSETIQKTPTTGHRNRSFEKIYEHPPPVFGPWLEQAKPRVPPPDAQCRPNWTVVAPNAMVPPPSRAGHCYQNDSNPSQPYFGALIPYDGSSYAQNESQYMQSGHHSGHNYMQPHHVEMPVSVPETPGQVTFGATITTHNTAAFTANSAQNVAHALHSERMLNSPRRQEPDWTKEFLQLFGETEAWAAKWAGCVDHTSNPDYPYGLTEVLKASSEDYQYFLIDPEIRFLIAARVINVSIVKYCFKEVALKGYDENYDRKIQTALDSRQSYTEFRTRRALDMQIADIISSVSTMSNWDDFLMSRAATTTVHIFDKVRPLLHQQSAGAASECQRLFEQAYRLSAAMFSVPAEWKFDFPEAGARTSFNRNIHESRGPIVFEDPAVLESRKASVKLSITPTVVKRGWSGMSVVPKTYAKAQVLVMD